MERKENEINPGKTVIISYDDKGIMTCIMLHNIKDYQNLVERVQQDLNFSFLKFRFLYEDDEDDLITVSNDEDLEISYEFFGYSIPRFIFRYETIGILNKENSVIKHEDNFKEESSMEFEIIDEFQENGCIENEINLPLQMTNKDISHDLEKEIRCLNMPRIIESHENTESICLKSKNLNNSSQKNWLDNEIIEDRIKPAVKEEIKNSFENNIKSAKSSIIESDQDMMSNCSNNEQLKQVIRTVIYDEFKTMISDIKSLVQHSIDKIQKCSQKYIKNSQINNDPSNLIANKCEETNEEAKVNKKVSPFHKAQKHQYSIKKAEFIKPIHLEVNKKCKEESPIIHKDIMCDECSQIPIIGARYVCLICENYDLCEKCEFNYHHKHPLLKVKNPEEFRKFLDYCNKRKINIS